MEGVSVVKLLLKSINFYKWKIQAKAVPYITNCIYAQFKFLIFFSST